MKAKQVISAALAAAMLLALAGCGKKDQPVEQTGPTGIAVQVEQVRKNEMSTENRVSGRVTSDGETMIMAPSNAKCTAVYVRAGDQVQAGEKICTLDVAGTLATYQAAKIGYDAAVRGYQDQKTILDSQVALAEKNFSDTKALLDIGAASQLEVDQAEMAALSARAQRDSALSQLEAGMQSTKSNVKQLDQVMEHLDSQGNLIAPVSGTLSALNAAENGFVNPSMPLAVIDGVDQTKIMVSVSEVLVPKIAIGDQADVEVESAGAVFTGTVQSVEKTANPQTRLYTVSLTVPPETAGLLPGMFAQVTFHTDQVEDTIVIPSEAILTTGTTQYVYVVEGTDAHMIEVKTGMTGNGVTQVLDGLHTGQQLVVVGQAYLSDGDPVRVVSEEG